MLGLSFVAYGRVCSLASRIAYLDKSVLDTRAREAQISEQVKLQFQLDSDLLLVAGNDSVKNVVKQFQNAIEKKRSSIQEHDQLRTLSLELAHQCGKAWLDSTKDDLDLQKKIRRGLYRQACTAADRLAQAADVEQVRHFQQQFWELYWGELAIVESPEVESAMVAFGKSLMLWQTGKAPLELQKLAAQLRTACHLNQEP